MLESVFIILLALGFITFLIALFEEWETVISFILCFVSMLFFIIAWSGSIYIEVPSVASFFNEPALGWMCVGFIFINVIGALISIMNINVELKRQKRENV